jgi:hypothetical protein
MKSAAAIVLVGLSVLVPFAPGRIQTPAAQSSIVLPLSESIIGDWRGFLILNDSRRNFTRVRAHLRFTRYGTVFYDREEVETPMFIGRALTDWRADYEVIGSAIYMNPHRGVERVPGAVVFSGVIVENDRLEAIVPAMECCEISGNPFGLAEIAAALRMQREQ